VGGENTPEASNSTKKGIKYYRSGSVRGGGDASPFLVKAPSTGTSELKINHLKDFMVVTGGRGVGSQSKHHTQAPVHTPFDQNRSNFKPISMDQGMKPISSHLKEGNGFGSIPAILTFRADSMNTNSKPFEPEKAKVNPFDRHMPANSGLKPASSASHPANLAAMNPRTTTDSRGFGIFDEQVSMALRSAERRPTPNLPTQTDLTEEDRIEEYSLVAVSPNTRQTASKH
jgi:hypothetical protein